MKSVKYLTVVLGVVSLLFGLLKFFRPFKDWYHEQITTSGLPMYSYYLGIAGEIITGLVFLLPSLIIMGDKRRRLFLIFASWSMISIMIVATIVHLMPQVPASVLPLKIKPPVIPLTIMLIAIYNLIAIHKLRKDKIIMKHG